eukprot:scaffold143970_cov130-Phaeocystis_antarctica.AAC.3
MAGTRRVVASRALIRNVWVTVCECGRVLYPDDADMATLTTATKHQNSLGAGPTSVCRSGHGVQCSRISGASATSFVRYPLSAFKLPSNGRTQYLYFRRLVGPIGAALAVLWLASSRGVTVITPRTP